MQLDNFSQLVGSGINIFGSRERIRTQLIDFAKEYLQLQTVDFYKTSALSYIIDTLSVLTANQLFYDSMIYREFFMVDAQMQESVYNLAAWIGYEVPTATPSKVDVMFTLPLSFTGDDSNFNIPNNFTAYAGTTPFLINSTYSNTSITASNLSPAAAIKINAVSTATTIASMPAATGQVINNSSVIITDNSGFQRPVYLYKDSKGAGFASFSLPFTQQQRQIIQFAIPSSIQAYQFYSHPITYNGMVSNIRVWVAEPKYGQKIKLDSMNQSTFDPSTPVPTYGSGISLPVSWVEWTQSKSGVYTMQSSDASYVFTGGQNTGDIYFGNGIVGKQPAANSIITVELYVTLGEDGNVIPNTINTGSKITYSITPIYDNNGNIINATAANKIKNINYTITNNAQSSGGINIPSLPEVKRQAIINLRSKSRLVSSDDYNDINTIVKDQFPAVEASPILKRSDIKVNEQMVFLRLQYHDENSLPQVVPTRNAIFSIYDPEFIDGKYTILRNSKILIDNEYYQTIYNATINQDTMTASYDYVVQNVSGSPVTMYEEEVPSWYQQYIYVPANTIDFSVILPTEGLGTSSSSSIPQANYPLTIKLNVNHQPSNLPVDYQASELRARLKTKWGNNQEYEEVSSYFTIDAAITPPNNKKYQYFEFEIPSYLTIPTESQRFEFYIDAKVFLRDQYGNFINESGDVIGSINDTGVGVEGWVNLYKYYADVLIRKDLSSAMMSSVTDTNTWDNILHTSTRYDIYDTPTILSSYMDAILARADNSQYPNFEVTVLQNSLSSLNISSLRMLTDFINVKYPDTYGTLNNLKYNPVDFIVKSRFHTPFKWEDPAGITFDTTTDYDFQISSSSSGSISSDLYIVNGDVPGYESMQASSYINSVAQLYSGIGVDNSNIWYLTKPVRGTYAKIMDELDSVGDPKVVVFTGSDWIDVQSFSIPLNIKLSVVQDSAITLSQNTIKQNIKDALIQGFSPYMGTQKELDRSQILQVVRSVAGVKYCEIISPEINIQFKYDISKDLTQTQLRNYVPQYVGFNEDSIDINITTS
jgi:hypothetical protein